MKERFGGPLGISECPTDIKYHAKGDGGIGNGMELGSQLGGLQCLHLGCWRRPAVRTGVSEASPDTHPLGKLHKGEFD